LNNKITYPINQKLFLECEKRYMNIKKKQHGIAVNYYLFTVVYLVF